MKQLLRKLFAPILTRFERGEGPYKYSPKSRWILIILGLLMLLLTSSLVFVGITIGEAGAFIPGAVFFCVSLVCLVIGALGSERAVAKVWGSK